ncbi:MAG: hypothetical protein AAGB51_11520 [Planctomycetota bacterium]
MIVITSVLVAIAVPAFSSISTRSRYNSAHSSFLSIDRAAKLYQIDWGGLPPNAAVGEMPPELSIYLQADVFAKPSPFGRAWDWNGPGSGIADHGPNLSIHTTTREHQDAMEQAFDDGSDTTGIYRRQSHYVVFPITTP